MNFGLFLSSDMAQSLYPEKVIIGGIVIPTSAVYGTVMVLLILVGCYFIRRRIPKWEDEPTGLQNAVEMIIDAVRGFTDEKVHPLTDSLAPFTLAFMTYILLGSWVELLGVSPITRDINCALALGLTSFTLVNITALKALGPLGRIKHLASPMAVVLPIRVLTDCISPLSMTLRLFANILVGYMIMHLVYQLFPVLLPAVLGAYFTILDAAIQSYVFGTLNLNYTQEALE